ncbi:MAG: ERF family protein [Muribaculaceae bacterium]|nr:ERF family protein [Muribaculaceae bacterium]
MEETNVTIPKAQSFMSEQIDEIATALSAFQGTLKQPKLSKEVSVKTKTGGSYKFKYADLCACVDAAAPVLKENGLAVSQIICNWTLVTLLTHKSGQWIKSELPITLNNGADYQALGSAITYIKRYSYCAILGIVADTDDDANAACGNEAVMQERPTVSTSAQLSEALDQLECCNSREDATKLWNEWVRKCPAICAQNGEFYKAVAAKMPQLEP